MPPKSKVTKPTRTRKTKKTVTESKRGLLDLPLEIIEAIFSRVDRKETWANLCRTSKSVSSIASKHLYHTVVLDDEVQIERILSTNVFHKHAVRNLTIIGGYGEDETYLVETVLKNVRGVERLALMDLRNPLPFARILDPTILMQPGISSQLRHLHLEFVEHSLTQPSQTLRFPHLISLSFASKCPLGPEYCLEFDVPQLLHLNLDLITRNGQMYYQAPHFHNLIIDILEQRGEHLRTLCYRNQDGKDHYRTLLDYLALCTSLRHLRIASIRTETNDRQTAAQFHGSAREAFEELLKNLRQGAMQQQSESSSSASGQTDSSLQHHPLKTLVYTDNGWYHNAAAKEELGELGWAIIPNIKDLLETIGGNEKEPAWFPELKEIEYIYQEDRD